MKQLIIKYSILLITTLIFVRVLTAVILVIWPDLLTTELPGGGTSTLGTGYLSSGFEYIFNILFIILIAKDLRKQELKSSPILIVTFFSSLVGVLFFLLYSAQKNLGLNKTNDK